MNTCPHPHAHTRILTLATRNTHKATEIARILPPCYELRTLAEYPEAPEIEESGSTFAANAELKACGISACIPGLVLADDSGLCVDALGGYPGVLSARYAGEHGNDSSNNAKLLRELIHLRGEAPYRARFVCAMCLAENGRTLAQFLGTVEGRITLTPRGENGFGYDPLFVPDGYGDKTFAQLSDADKDTVSHRGAALRQLAAYLSQASSLTAL